MNLKQLEAFVRVAELKSFSEAAKRLYLAQPTVSAHVASLEKELGVCLLMRSTKEVSLTEEGKTLYGYAGQMLELEQKIRAHFENRGRERQVLCIAASTIPSQYLLPEIMARFRSEYPQEQLQVMETDSAEVVEQVISRHAEIGFTGTVLERKQCVYFPFYQDELVVIAPGGAKSGPREGENPAEWIRSQPMILREVGSGTRKEAQRLLQQMGIDPSELNIVASIQNQETIKRSVESGMGISILSRLAAEEEIADGKLCAFPLGETGGKRSINLVLDRTCPRSPAAARFLDVMKKMYPVQKQHGNR